MRSQSKLFSPLLIGLIVICALIIVTSIFFTVKAITSPKTSNSSLVEAEHPLATATINKEFNFPLKNDKGDEVAKIKFLVQSAQFYDQIIVKGQRVTAVSGKKFLVVNLKITNDYKQTFNINTRDYIRLVSNNNDKEPLAPEIHNDPVEVQAISTKYTRVGFTINASDKNLKLKVGEISGDKTTIDLNFK